MIEWTGSVWDMLRQAGWQLHLPLYGIAAILIYARYNRQVRMQRRALNAKVQSAARETVRSILWGAVFGAAVSVPMWIIGARLDSGGVIWLWLITLAAVLVRYRFACAAYAVGLIALLQAAGSWIPGVREQVESITFISSLFSIHLPSLLIVIALLHAAEAFLIRQEGKRASAPLYMKGKRGRMIGAYELQRFMPVPLLIPVPAGTGDNALLFDWPFLFPLDGGAGWAMLFVPLLVGYSERSVSSLPALRARQTGMRMLAYAVFVAAMAAVCVWYEPAALICGMLTPLLHELVRLIGKQKDDSASPMFVPVQDGLKVMGALPGSAAAEADVRPGEIVVNVNGMRVCSKEELHAALQINSAFCKLEIINPDGEIRYVQRPIFAGERHMLGLIPVPEGENEDGAAAAEKSIFSGWIAPAARKRVPFETLDAPDAPDASAAPTADHVADSSDGVSDALPDPGSDANDAKLADVHATESRSESSSH